MIKRTIIFLGILQSILCHASEKNNEPVLFEKIKSETHTKNFSGKIIAYKTQSGYFKGSPFKDDKGQQYFYGYISENSTVSGTGEQCYTLFKVISGIGKHRTCLLTSEKIKNSSLCVREATPKELEALNRNFKKNRLAFPYNSLAAEKAMKRHLNGPKE